MTTRSRAFVAYSQLHLAPLGTSPVLDPTVPLGLAQIVDDESLVIVTGISMGPVWITVGLDSGPVDEAGAGVGWEERAELVLDVPNPLFLSSPTVDTALPGAAFTPAAPGRYAVVVLACGRGARPDDTLDPDDEAPEEYLVTFSPVDQ